MRAILAPLKEMGDYEQIISTLKSDSSAVFVSGCADSQKCHMAYGLSDGFKYKIIVTFSEKRAREIIEDCRLYDRNVMNYPAKDLIFFQADINGNELTTERMKVLRRILENRPVTVVTTFDALMTPQPPLFVIENHILKIGKHATISTEDIAKSLVTLGYEKNYQVEAPGQFSIRGDIIDIFDLTEENPYRIELWGDDVESIRSFDILSQRSIEKLESISIYPASEMVLTKDEICEGLKVIEKDSAHQEEILRKQGKIEEAHRLKKITAELSEELLELGLSVNAVNLESYLKYFYKDTDSFIGFFPKGNTVFILDEQSRLKEHALLIETEFMESMINRVQKGYILPRQADMLLSIKETCARLSSGRTISFSVLETGTPICAPGYKTDAGARNIASYNNSFEALVKDLEKYKKQGYRILLLSGSRTRARRLAEDLRDRNLSVFYTEDAAREIMPGEVMTYYGHADRGFEYPLLKFAVIAENDIFGAGKKKKKKKKYTDGQKIEDFGQLKVGDYVVHENHGLGVYKGIEKIEIDKVTKDYMKIEYRDGGNLYVLATAFSVLQKYSSAEGARPKLNKLGGQEWDKTKTKVREAVNEVAQDLVNLYAARQQADGYVYGPDTVWQREFEELFPYEETEDQLLAIEATKADMESSKIMDRLICGDVGFGKTEIAIRAAFKAVQEGKQVVFLVPTTILAQQHYNTFTQRMKDFPVRIDMLSRFRTSSEQRKTVEDLKRGMVDIVIGTHRVLSADVGFKDLGLLVIDEEQRFGVTHKEKIKKLKESVDVLTLTATPIPRTLHMSLIGIRDMSVLDEAPEDRQPIQTYVCEYNEELVREAINRELSRGGQVYYVYNRVNTIADITAQLSRLLPEANIAFAHGQMKESELERIMYDFISGEIDVLVSTTIIETGMDIPNVNTMIVHDSDNMGLSQLYQLRGRVGRSGRTSYAFLMYKKDKLLKEIAEKRLEAIREFTDLGSGFKIAMRDLEIRGAGNLLGRTQHGHMQAVGYDMYCRMLNEAVRNLKGIHTEEEYSAYVDLDVDAYIPDSYIVNEVQKLDIYKRITGITNEHDCEDMKEELLDRFGAIPDSADNLLRIALIRAGAEKLRISEIRGKGGEIEFAYRNDSTIDVASIPAIIGKYEGALKFDPRGIPTFRYKYRLCGIVEKDEENLLNYAEQIVRDMNEILLHDLA